MAEKHSVSEDIPLPDPDRLQRAATAAVEKVRANTRLYIGLGVFVIAAVIVILLYANRSGTESPSEFTPLWLRAEAAREKLAINVSAAEELRALESYLEEIRGTREEGLALWFLGMYRYREAYTDDKVTLEDRRPHLKKALEHLEALQAEEFDGLLLAKPRWYTSTSKTPIDELTAQVRKDLAYEEANAYEEPQPDSDLVAVLRTSAGDVFLQFYGKLAPRHVENFVTLATLGTYNGTAFHFVRHVADEPRSLMAGDPYSFFYNDPKKKDHILRWGKGGVGYGIAPEESRFRVLHRPRIVTSSRRDKSDWDNGVQFQIVLSADPDLDRLHTPFAKVTEGMEVVEKAATAKTATQHNVYRDDFSFGTQATRYLVVEPVILHKVVVYRDRKAIEHQFDLTEAEKSLDSVKGSPVTPLPEEQAHCGRELRAPDAEGEIKRGLHIPLPEDVDAKEADLKGDRKAGA